MEQHGLKIEKSYVEFIYSYLKPIKGLDPNYSINRLSYLMRTNYDFLKETLSFQEYVAVGMGNFITEELTDRLESINKVEKELETIEFTLSVTKEDVDYFYDSIKKSHIEYLPYIFDHHVIKALLSSPKGFLTLKCRELHNDAFFKGDLMANIQYQLVGRAAPPPCANGRIKRAYYSLFENLEKRTS